MLERILVPLDGSPTAESILVPLQRLLKRTDAEVHLLRVVAAADPDGVVPSEFRVHDAERYVEGVRRRLEEQGVRAFGRVRTGSPAETIAEAAGSLKASLIVMGTHGRSGISRWILGSVTEKVMKISGTPMFITRPEVQELPFGRILVPVDGSDTSLAVLPAVKDLAAFFGSRVVLLHVMSGGKRIAPSAEVEHALDGVAAELTRAGIPVTTLLRRGDPASEIVDSCVPVGIDLIAMTTHGASGFKEWFFGGVAAKVIRTAPAALLVWPSSLQGVTTGKEGAAMEEGR